MGYLCAIFSLPMPLCSGVSLDVRDRQTDVRQHHRLMTLPYRDGGIIIDPLSFLTGCGKRRLNQAISVLSLSTGFLSVLLLFIRATFVLTLVLFVCVLSLDCCWLSCQ